MPNSVTFIEHESIPRDRQRDDKPASNINVGETERWVSMLTGGILLLYGLKRRSLFGMSVAALGGGMLYRGTTGHCTVYDSLNIDTAVTDEVGIHVEKAITINRSAEDLYRFWRDFENLPRFMTHLESVRILDEKHSHWVAKAPAGMTVEWDAEIVIEQENQAIMWRSLLESQVANAGSVRFDPAPGGRGTEVRVSLSYNPPAGALGATIAKLFGEEPSQQIEKDLRRFKQLMEAGEIPTTQGQPSGASLKRRLKSNLLPSANSRQIEEPGNILNTSAEHKSRWMDEAGVAEPERHLQGGETR